MSTKIIQTFAWDADARTIDYLTGDGSFSFSVGKAIGIVCGLNNQNNGRDYFEIDHAFYIDSDEYRIIENGSYKTASHTYAVDAVFTIERINKKVRYFVGSSLVYTSLKPSAGVVFGDCSLYAYLDTILDACLTDYPDTSSGDIFVGPVVAVGTDAAVNVGYAGIGPLYTTSTEKDLNKGQAGLGPLWAIGYDGEAAFGVAGIGPFASTGLDTAIVAPDFSAGTAYLGPLGVYSYEGVLDVNTGDINLGSLWAFGSDAEVNVGQAFIGPIYAIGNSQAVNFLYAEWPAWSVSLTQLVGNIAVTLTIPAPILTASANHDDNIQLAVTVPAPILTAFTGGVANLTALAPILTSTGTVQVIAKAELEVPAPVLTATALNSILASVGLEIPAPILQAATGAYAVIEVLAPILTATGKVDGISRIELSIPAPELIATAKVGSITTVTLEIPAPIITANGIVGAIAQVILTVPAPLLTSYAQVSPGPGLPATVVVTETTYAINLNTGAVTTLLLGELNQLVSAHGRLYGLQSGNLVRLDGDLDGATTIPATVRFAPQTFGTNRAKRLSTVYLSIREDDGLTLEVIPDENTAWRYQTNTDNSAAYGTHKIKTGRGLKFHTASLQLYNRNGGRMDVGGIELLVDPLSRRPKT